MTVNLVNAKYTCGRMPYALGVAVDPGWQGFGEVRVYLVWWHLVVLWRVEAGKEG